MARVTNLVSIAPSASPDVTLELLINTYEEPMDPEDVPSTIQSIARGTDKSNATVIYSTDEWLTALDTSPSGWIVACSMDGNLHVRDARGWSVLSSGCDAGLNDVYVADEHVAFSVALTGEVLRIAGRVVSTDFAGNHARLNAVHGCSARCVYAVGDDGVVLHYDGSTWRQVDALTNVNLLSVLCLSPDNVYVAGTKGVAFHWDGQTWHSLSAPEVNFSSLAFYQGKLYLAAGKAGIHVLDRGVIAPFKELILYRLCVIGDLMNASGGNLLAFYNGQGWAGERLSS